MKVAAPMLLADFPVDSPISGTRTIGKTAWHFIFLFVGLGVFLTFLIGQRGLNEPDEGRYAGMALEMLEGDGWLEPRTSDFAHYDKPPLIYWVTALSFKCFGETELAARLPSVLGALFALAGLAWAAWRLYGQEIAWWSVLVLGTLAQFWLLTRFLTPDMLLTGWCTLAIAAWAEARHRNGHCGFWFLSLFFWTLAWWTKATPALVPFIGLTVAVWLTKDSIGRKALRPLSMLAGILILGSPWYLLMMSRHPDLVQFFLGHELTDRLVGGAHGRHKPFYFYLLTSWIAWLPWLPMLAIAAFCKREHFAKLNWRTMGAALSWDGCIAAAGLVILSVNSSKLMTYTLPLAPWVALFLTRVLVRVINVSSSFRRVALTISIMFAVFMIAGVMVYPRWETRLGLNSSLRPIAKHLQARGAQVVLLDKYWPSMEFYIGENVYYVGKKSPRELIGDTGFCKAIGGSHFWNAEELEAKLKNLPGTGTWIVHYLPEKDAAFARLQRTRKFLEREKIGDFELLRLD